MLGARRGERLEALARELLLPEGSVLTTDVTDPAQVKALVDQAVQLHGRIDVDINEVLYWPTRQEL